MTTLEAKVILALADTSFRIEATAQKLYMHRTTLNRLIRKIKRDTGLNPLDFYDMEWLVPKAKAIVGMYGYFYNGGATND